MARIARATKGDVFVKKLRPFGVRNRQEHLIVRSPWSALKHAAQTGHQKKYVEGCVAQAESLYQNAAALGSAAKPLLFYYVALNLVKGLAASRDATFSVRTRLMHGLSEDPDNFRNRLALDSHRIDLKPKGVFPRFMETIGEPFEKGVVKIGDLLDLPICVQRAWSSSRNRKAAHIPIDEIECVRDSASKGSAWVRLSVPKAQVARLREFARKQHVRLKMVRMDGLTIAESEPFPFDRSANDVLDAMREALTTYGVQPLLTNRGYRTYFLDRPWGHQWSQLAVLYMCFFYLGSVARYRPYDFQELLAGNHGWILAEILQGGPEQFLFLLASEWLQRPVVMPGA